MQRIYPRKTRPQVFSKGMFIYPFCKIIPIYMQYDEAAHDKKQVHHQVAFLKEHGCFGRHETRNSHFKMEYGYKQSGNSPEWRQIG